jgi:hypothetical protein
MQAYAVLVDNLGFERRIDKFLPTVYGVVSQLEFRTHKYKAGFHHVAGQILRTKRAVTRYTDEELLGYRRCDDRAIYGCLKLLVRTGSIAWMSNRIGDVVLMSMLSCHISLSKGLAKFSANAFAGFAVVLAKMGDIKTGRRFGRLALEMSYRFQAKECDGQLVYYAFIHHTMKPMHELLDLLIQAGQFAKASGDIEHSQHACCVCTFTYIICGLPLNGIEEDAKVFITEMQQYKNSAALTLIRL